MNLRRNAIYMLVIKMITLAGACSLNQGEPSYEGDQCQRFYENNSPLPSLCAGAEMNTINKGGYTYQVNVR